jgi:hypothetical protein
MKQYLISVYQPAGQEPPPPERLEEVSRDLDAVRQEIEEAGAWVFGGGLHAPDTATVARRQDDGEVLVTDGPFAEGKEYLGGISIIAAADLDEALGWTRKLAAAIGLPLEVRPFMDESER